MFRCYKLGNESGEAGKMAKVGEEEESNRGSPRTFPLDHSEPLGLTPAQGSSWTPQVLSPPASHPHPCWVLVGDGQERPQCRAGRLVFVPWSLPQGGAPLGTPLVGPTPLKPGGAYGDCLTEIHGGLTCGRPQRGRGRWWRNWSSRWRSLGETLTGCCPIGQCHPCPQPQTQSM